MQNIPTNREIINQFKLISTEQPYVILKKSERNPNKKWRGENSLSRIKRRGKIRIGYYKIAMPFSFFNQDSILVGYGIDLAHQLAKDLEVSIEFVPIGMGLLISELDQDYFDIVMSDVFLSSKYAEEIALSKPYLHVSLALLTKRENNNFDSFETTIKLDTFTISYFQRAEIANEFLSYFPHGGSFPIISPDQFLNPKPNDSIKIDAHLTSAERAAAMTVYRPNYKVVNPLPYHLKNALVFPIAQDDVWKRYIDNWIDFRTNDLTFERIYDQWILGKEFIKEKKTWSIYENILQPKWESRKEKKAKVREDKNQ